jgi:type 1 glutamine amidotransferase
MIVSTLLISGVLLKGIPQDGSKMTHAESSLRVKNPKVLLFSKTKGFRHDSIETARDRIIENGSKSGMSFEWTEDSSKFNSDYLKRFDSIVFLMTTGDVLNEGEQSALERFVEDGKGWVGVHSASDTEYEWPWYGNLVGAYFKSHPPQHPKLTIRVESEANPGSFGLPKPWQRSDEWYDFRANPRSKVNVLLSLDEKEYKQKVEDHPISWWHWQGKGKAWYTGMGHTKESYTETAFMQHLMGGILWASQHDTETAVETLQKPKDSKWLRDLKASEVFETKSKASRFALHAEFKADTNQGLEVRIGSGTTINLSSSAGSALMTPSEWNEIDLVFESYDGKIASGKPNGRVIDCRINSILQFSQEKLASSSKGKPIEYPVTFSVQSGKLQVRNVQMKLLGKN